jgi:cytochrome c
MPDIVRSLSFLAFAALSAGCGQQESAGEASSGGSVAALTIEERGHAAFSACAICHSTKDPSAAGYAPMVGPSLFGVYGAKAGHVASYDYSQAMREANLIWNDETLDKYIAHPQEVVPKTRMAYVGEANPEKRAAIIAYLKTLK